MDTLKEKIKCKVAMLHARKRENNSHQIYQRKKVLDSKGNGLSSQGMISFFEDKWDDPAIANYWTPQHLYFISDSEIIDGDYFITIGDFNGEYSYKFSSVSKCIRVQDTETTLGKALFINETGGRYSGYHGTGDPHFAKIEASTDPLLDLPLIPQSFIRKFAEKNGEIKEVLLECGKVYQDWDEDEAYEFELQVMTRLKDNTCIVHPVSVWSMEQIKEIEKIAERFYNEGWKECNLAHPEGFKALWSQTKL